MTGQGNAKPPISSHPAFPAIVALWFAALLGVGSMMLPVVLLEKLTTATGLAAVLPAAQPPLGVTARILIALVAAGIGVAAGLAIARQVVAAQAVERPRRRRAKISHEADRPAKRPISARDEIDVEKLDAEVPVNGRRRALSVTEESGRSDYFDAAPLPGFDPYGTASVADDAPAAEALDLSGFAEDDSYEAPDGAPEALPEQAEEIPEPATEAAPPAQTWKRRDFIAPVDAAGDSPVAQPEERQLFRAPETASAEFEPAAPEHEEETADFGDGSPAPFVRHADDDRSAPSPFDAAPVETGLAAPTASEPQSAITDSADLANLSARPLGELGMVELVERFALSLQRRAETEKAGETLALPQFKANRVAAQVQDAPEEADDEPATGQAVPPIPVAFTPDQPAIEQDNEFEEVAAAFAPADFAPPAPVVPAALRPLALDDEADFDDDGEDDVLSALSLPLDAESRPFAQPEPQLAAETVEPVLPAALQEIAVDDAIDDDEDEDGGEGEGYSSLLAMKSPLGQAREFVRIDDESGDDGDEAIEPVVVFPGQQQPRRAVPASDGPSREALAHSAAHKAGFRPFDGPAHGQQATHGDFASPAMPTRPADKRADPGETERALREALEKLQRMSGAA